MASNSLTLPAEYWQTLQISKQDTEYLHTHLFESETPMTARELIGVLIEERIKFERAALAKKRQSGGAPYLPKDHYKAGDQLTFPALDWVKGKVKDVRTGVNPQYGEFSVMTVEMESGGTRLFATDLADHILNDEPVAVEEETIDPKAIQNAYGQLLELRLEASFAADDGLVRIAGRWFPRALLVDVNEGHLNLAEAVLDMAGGEPLPTSELLKDVELPEGVNPKLAEFSLNLALQDDARFDEVGPAGEVLWCLQRLEPEGVRGTPLYLRYTPIEHDSSVLTEEMLELEAQLDDELSEAGLGSSGDVQEVIISLIYPHWRAGTLPITAHIQSMFPTAYESPRVRFSIVDGKTGDEMPTWVVREKRYVYGLREWYESNGLMPGSLVRVRRSQKPGQVIIEAQTHRTTKDWVRTAIVGTDGGMVFALLKQPVTAEFNERMAFAIPSVDVVDQLWEQGSKKQRPFEKLVVSVMRELTKLNPQGHVHAQELYSAVNIVRRVPPAPLLALLASRQGFVHVGDLHFRLGDDFQEE